MLTDRDVFFFDLQGFVLLRGAISPDHVAQCNAILDELQDTRHGEWRGHVHGHTFGGKDGLNLQQIYEAGEPFERLIDNPSWIEHVKRFVGGEGTFDHHHGAVYVDENFASIRGPGEAIGVHSGGHSHCMRTQFHVANQKFHCGQINVLFALNDVGPGDGATMVVPASHKANFEHPDLEANTIKQDEDTSADGVEGAIEVHMRAGDALVFVDALMHGSAKRTNPGQRRICVYRYGPSWGASRHGYAPSEELLARLTPERRAIVAPTHHRVRRPEPAAATR